MDMVINKTQNMETKLNRNQLIELANKIITFNGSEEEHTNLILLFDQNTPRPNGSNLFFYPENYNARRDNISNYIPNVEEVVDKCLEYKPLII